MIPALTVRQPWASAFFTRPENVAKDIENRTWSVNYRGPLAIHAGQQLDEGGVDYLCSEGGDRGAVLGLVELVDCHVAGSDRCYDWGCEENPWAFFPPPLGLPRGQRLVHWRVERPREFVTPIPARGRVGLWTPGPSLAGLLELSEVLL
jgi:hypothetical protein